MSKDPLNLLWLDFETNGLHGGVDEVVVLEIAAVVTNSDLDILDEYSSVVEPHREEFQMGEYVLNMHKQNGLLDDVRSGAGKPYVQIDYDLSTLVEKHFPSKGFDTEIAYEYKGAVLAGSSVGAFDLRILTEHFPETRKLCSHRVYDISAVNEFIVREGKLSVNTAESAAESAHRALSDIYDSIGKARELSNSIA